MNFRLAWRSLLVAELLFMPVARAEPPTDVQVEINFLLGYVEGSSCEFYRNGAWHDAKSAHLHLRDKYKYMAAANWIKTTEELTARAATESSFSGQPYQVKCNGGVTDTTNQWLRDELARFRLLHRRPASILLEPRPACSGMKCLLDASGLAGNCPKSYSSFLI